MPIQGRFLVNNQSLAPLEMFGVGTYMAFQVMTFTAIEVDVPSSRMMGRYPQENTGLLIAQPVAYAQKHGHGREILSTQH